MTRYATDDLQQFLDDLTPEQRQQIADTTAQEWMDALGASVKDPTFWKGIGAAFLEGMARGFDQHLNDR
jgi:hypothetical protein